MRANLSHTFMKPRGYEKQKNVDLGNLTGELARFITFTSFGGKKTGSHFFDVTTTYMPAQPEELDLYRVTETKQGGRKRMPPYVKFII